MKNTKQQLIKLKWTGPSDKSGKFHSARMNNIIVIMLLCIFTSTAFKEEHR